MQTSSLTARFAVGSHAKTKEQLQYQAGLGLSIFCIYSNHGIAGYREQKTPKIVK